MKGFSTDPPLTPPRRGTVYCAPLPSWEGLGWIRWRDTYWNDPSCRLIGVGGTRLKLVGQLAILVFGVGNEFLIFTVHHPIQIFQRNLADDVR